MFTGIIEEIGILKNIDRSNITIQCQKVLDKTQIGDSIAVNGCCQTVVSMTSNSFSVNVSEETFKVTNFNFLKTGDKVNLERALTPSSRMGGHIVQGHIETLAKFVKQEQQNDFYNLFFEFDKNYEKYIVKKGSITLNGISLTVADIQENILKIAVIPHTYSNTNLKNLKIGDKINMETDILGKYVEKFLSTSDNGSGIDLKFLTDNGF